MTKSAQERIAAMENALEGHKAANGRPFASCTVHVMATSRGWVVFIDNGRMSDYFTALDAALVAAEARVQGIVNANNNLARTLGIAS